MNREQIVERLKIVRQAILDHKEQFNYAVWSCEIDKLIEERTTSNRSTKDYIDVAARIQNDCGTCGCVAGFTISCIPQEQLDKVTQITFNSIFDVAYLWIGISYDEASALFYGRGHWLSRINKSMPNIPNIYDSSVTVNDAISRLDLLIENYE